MSWYRLTHEGGQKVTKCTKKSYRYSVCFKQKVVEELQEGGLSLSAISRKYGIKGGSTVKQWVQLAFTVLDISRSYFPVAFMALPTIDLTLQSQIGSKVKNNY
jgi:hypothetical protein